MSKKLAIQRLTQAAFAPFGDVVEAEGRDWFHINQGTTQRYHKQTLVDVSGDGAKPGISIFRGDAFEFPLEIKMLERHPYGSQSFIPCNNAPFVVVVAPNGKDDKPDESGLVAFYAEGNQGVNYHRGTWHHPLVTIGKVGDFVVVDRVEGSQHNCDECNLSQTYRIEGKPS